MKKELLVLNESVKEKLALASVVKDFKKAYDEETAALKG